MRWMLLAWLCTALVGCAGHVSIDSQSADAWQERPSSQYLTRTDTPSSAMRLAGVLDDQDVESLITSIDQADHDPALKLAAAEARLRWAETADIDESLRQWGFCNAAMRAMYVIQHRVEHRQTSMDNYFDLGVSIYNRATARLAQATHPLHEPLRLEGPLPQKTIYIIQPAHGNEAAQYAPGYFDELHYAAEIDVEGLEPRHVLPGLGGAMVGVKDNQEDWEQGLNRFPPEGIVRGVTAVLTQKRLTFDLSLKPHFPQVVTVDLSLEDADISEGAKVHDALLPLNADPTATLATLLSRTELPEYGLRGMLSPDELSDRKRVYLLERYQPDAIPVLMIHGLMSSPYTWRGVVNDLASDRDLSRQYQVWHYLYPTGVPFVTSAAVLRQELDAIRQEFDPEGDDLASNNMIVMGHSMGGLIAKSLVRDSGDDLWNAAFRVPIDELNGEPEHIEHLRQVFYWKANPAIKRLVFIATPHGGSDMANSPLGSLGLGMINQSDELEELAEITLAQNPASTFVEDETGRPVPKSIDLLRPGNLFLVAIDKMWQDVDVPFHSIIGDRGKDEPIDETSDGVVAYTSSHLPYAESELVVPAGHNAHEHPAAIGEIRRILLLHAKLVEREMQLKTMQSESESVKIHETIRAH